MVESETFVSRRKKTTERRAPRKLFTARGLVESDLHVVPLRPMNDEGEDHIPDEKPRASTKKKQISFVCEDTAQLDRLLRVSSSDKSGSEEDFSNDSSQNNSLEDVLQMGCMDGLFFSGMIDKSRTAISKFEQQGKKNLKTFISLPVPNINLMSQGKDDSNVNRSIDSSFPGRLDCQLPYQNITDQVTDTQHLSRTIGPFLNGYDRPNQKSANYWTFNHNQQFLERGMIRDGEWNLPSFNRRLVDAPVPSIESPPSQIFIGEQPCFSDELIPVDDLPPPTVTCNLTKYHPKPLTLRQNYAFGKPMLSIDSDESDPTSDLPTQQVTLENDERSHHLDSITAKKTEMFAFDDSSYPSLDEADPSFDQPGSDNSRNVSDLATTSSFLPENKKSDIDAVVSTELDENILTVTERSVTTGGSSLAVSAATDQAITSEEPKKATVTTSVEEVTRGELSSNAGFSNLPANEPLKSQGRTNTTQMKISPSVSTGSSSDDDGVMSNSVPQDENITPIYTGICAVKNNRGFCEKNYDHPQFAQRLKSYPVGSPIDYSTNSQSPSHVSSSADTRRKPFELMVGTNMPQSPNTNADDEFFSPKGPSPNKRNSSKAGDMRRFRFEDSFDESEFYDTTMA